MKCGVPRGAVGRGKVEFGALRKTAGKRRDEFGALRETEGRNHKVGCGLS